MPRNITVTFGDGTTHTYQNAPDDVTPDSVQARAEKEFSKSVTSLDGGRNTAPVPSAPVAPTGSTQPGTMDAYTTRRAPSSTISKLLQPRVESEAVLSALRGLSSGVFGTLGGLESMVTPEAPQGSPLRGHETTFNTPEEIRQLYSKLGWSEPTTSTGKTAQMIGEVAPAIAMIGPGIVKGGLSVARKFGGATADILNPSRLKTSGVAEALNNDPVLMGQVKALLDQGLTIQQAAVLTKSQGLASFADRAANSSNATQRMYTDIADALKASQTNQLATASQNVNALTQKNLPVATAAPSAPRRAVKQALAGEAATLQGKQAAMTGQLTAEQQAAEEAMMGRQTAMTGQLTAEQQASEEALAAYRQKVEGGIANVSQLETGKSLTAANKAIQDATRKTVVTPAYNAAFAAAPGATISLNGLAATAEGQLGKVLTEIKGTEMAPNASALLERYGPRQVESVVQGVPVKTLQSSKPVTFEEASDISKAINMDLNKLKGLNDTQSNIARKHLIELGNDLSVAIEKGVPKEAFDLYGKANKIFKDEIIGVHKTGQVANLDRISTLNEPMLRPGDVVNKVLSDEGNTRQFLKVFEKNPDAMGTLKTGIEDVYRQNVLAGGKAATPERHAQFMSDHARQLRALDEAGMDMSTRLNQIGGQVGDVTAAEELLTAQGKAIPGKVKETFKPEMESLTAQGKAIPGKVKETFKPEMESLTAQGKAIPGKVSEAFKAEDDALSLASSTLGFRQTGKLRSAIVSDPEVASQALTRMGAPAKSSLARGVMQDAGQASDPLKHLIDNEQGIMRVLKAHDPKTAKATFDSAKDYAELASIIEKTGNKLGVVSPKNALASQQHLDTLTQGLPEVKAVVKDIQTRLAQGEEFETLVKEGNIVGNSPLKLFSNETKPHLLSLNRLMSMVNVVLTKLEGKIDKKLAVEIATELSNPVTAAKLVEKAQVKQIAKNRLIPARPNQPPRASTVPLTLNALASTRKD